MLPARNHALMLGLQAAPADAARDLRTPRPPGRTRCRRVTIQIDEAETATAAQKSGARTTSTSRWSSSNRRTARSPGRCSDYIRAASTRAARATWCTVFIPEYVVGHWWEQLLHNQSALRLKARLLFEPGVMVTSVPWQLHSSRVQPQLVSQPPPQPKVDAAEAPAVKLK